MKITQETPNLMVLKEKNIIPFVLGGVFILVGFLGIFSPNFLAKNVPLWLYIFFILLGLLTIFTTKITTVTLDKNTNRLSFLFRRLFDKEIKEYSLDQIKEIQLLRIYKQVYT